MYPAAYGTGGRTMTGSSPVNPFDWLVRLQAVATRAELQLRRSAAVRQQAEAVLRDARRVLDRDSETRRMLAAAPPPHQEEDRRG